MSEATLTAEDTLAATYAVLEAKAAQDAAFRAELLANPKAAFEKTFGAELPAHIKLKAVEQPADTYVIVVPTAPAVAADGELSDDDLEAVAGGSKSGARNFFNSIAGTVKKEASIFGGQWENLGNKFAQTVQGQRPRSSAGRTRESFDVC